LVELGVAREKLSLLGVIASPFVIVVPFVIKKYINGPKPLDFFRKAYFVK